MTGKGRTVQLDINISGIESALKAAMPRQSDVPRILKGAQAMAMHYWKTKAQQELRSTSRDYVAAVQPGESTDDRSVSIVLQSDNKIVDMIENGFKGGDMRTWMFSSSKTRTTKSGHKLLVIPFRHGSEGTSGRNVGQTMPGAIAAAAAKLLPTLSRPKTAEDQRGGTLWGKGDRYRLGSGSRGVKGNAEATKLMETKSQPWHSSSVFEGMIRKGQPTKAGVKTSGYTTFRTISSKPGADPRSWFHPGIRARKFAQATQDHVGEIITKVIASAIATKDAKRGTP